MSTPAARPDAARRGFDQGGRVACPLLVNQDGEQRARHTAVVDEGAARPSASRALQVAASRLRWPPSLTTAGGHVFQREAASS